MTYKSAAALEMAVKAAASASELDTNRAISSFYFHRLLCRVFAGGNDAFVLKGGQSMLARTIDARATRDIDLLATRDNLDEALQSLIELAQADMDDFITFEFSGSRPIKVEDEYRSGLSVRFVPIIGAKHMQQIVIDLVIDQIPLEGTELITPADRIDIEGLQACAYLVYSVESALADKLCALAEKHDGRVSSRVKDLVDIAIYATTCSINGDKLQKCVHREAAVRRIVLPKSFAIPEGWDEFHEERFEKLCSQTGLFHSLRSIDASAKLARRLFDPALAGLANDMTWNPQKTAWEE